MEGKEKVLAVSDEAILLALSDIYKRYDIETMTVKIIKTKLENKFKCSLDEKKVYIKEKIIEHLLEKEAEETDEEGEVEDEEEQQQQQQNGKKKISRSKVKENGDNQNKSKKQG